MLYIEGCAKRIKLMFAGCGPLAQANKPICKLLPIIRENGANANWTGTLEVTQKPAGIGCRLCIENADEDPPRGPINGYEKIAAAAFISHLGQLF